MRVAINEFLGAFYPDPEETIWLIGFPAKKLPDGHTDKDKKFKKSITRTALSENKLLQSNLLSANKSLGLYFVVNAGGTELGDIKRINAVFCEFDDRAKNEQHQLYDAMPLPPSIRTETSKSVHAYWLLSDAMTTEQFRNAQCSLIEKFGSDPKIKNQNRVMRMPHFNHVAWNGTGYDYKPVTIHTFEPDTRYTAEQLGEAFPYTPPPQPKFAEKGFIDDTWEGVKQELRYRISQLPSYKVERSTGWATAKGICHDGKNNTALCVNLRTGAVHCQAGCDYFTILHAFGLQRPERRSPVARVPQRDQSSYLYQYLMERRRY